MTPRKSYDYDVVIASDLRYPGGNSSSIAEEIKAQFMAGYSTAIMHLPAGHMTRLRSFNHKLIHCISTGMATLEPASRRLRARALVVRQPRIFADPLPLTPRIEADAKVLVINHPPFDGFFPIDNPYYKPEEVRERSEALFGKMVWAPIGPQPREALLETGADLNLASDDWHNIINVDEWATVRTRFVTDVPVIGRHSRDHVTKWLADPEDILAAYPNRRDIAVKILGGAECAVEALGRTPSNWTVYPFGSIAPADFLGEIDFFVYFHHPDWVEAFGRNIIEALASGVPAILPNRFKALFRDAAIYGSPQEVLDLVTALYADPGAYHKQADHGKTFVSEQFGASVHIRRLESLIGKRLRRRKRQLTPPRRRRALLVSMQRDGMGSPTRLLRLAEALPPHIEPVLILPNQGMDIAARNRYLAECIQVGHEIGDDGRNRLSARIAEIIDREKPNVIVFDGRSLAGGVTHAVRDAGVPALWVTPRRRLPERSLCEIFRAVMQVEDVSDQAGHDQNATNVVRVPPFAPTGPGGAHRGSLVTAENDPQRPRALIALGPATAFPEGVITITNLLDVLWESGFEPVVADAISESLQPYLPGSTELVTIDCCNPRLEHYDIALISPKHTLMHDLLRSGVAVAVVDDGLELDSVRDAALKRARECDLVTVVDIADQAVLIEQLRTLRSDRDVIRDRTARGREAVPNDGALTAARVVTKLVDQPDASFSSITLDMSQQAEWVPVGPSPVKTRG
jgi:hypothetical protein